MKKKKEKKLKLYEVGVPVQQIWVMRVWAYNKQDAWDKAEGPEAIQVHSLSGTKRSVTEIEPEKE